MDKEYSDSEKLKKRERELSILNTIARELSSHTNLEYALNTALTQVAELLDLKTGWIFLVDEKTDETHLAASLNLPPALLKHRHLLEGTCYCLELYQANNLKAAANINVITCSRLYGMVDTNGLRFHASIPLNANNKKLGVLNVASTNWKELSNDDLTILYTIGDLLAIAIERARLFDKSISYGAMEERYRLARELHDTLGQSLAAIILRLETADALLEMNADNRKIRDTIDYTLKLARNNLEEARRSVLNLRAVPLEDKTLVQAINLLIDDLKMNESLEVSFNISEKEYKLDALLESTLYRIIQESLNNIVKHANAENVEINISIVENNILLTIKDDGKGFAVDKVSKERHGLIGLNERIKLLKGSFDIETCPGKGAKLTFSIPMEQKKIG